MSGDIHKHNIKLYSILIHLPSDVQDDAEEILHTIECSNENIDWDDDYRLIVNDRTYYHTDMIELVSYLMYPTDDRLEKPKGLDIFVDALKDIGLDSKWVKNEDVIQELDEENKTDTEEGTDGEEEDVPPSPTVQGQHLLPPGFRFV